MKRLITCLLAFAMIFSLAGCGESETPPSASSSSQVETDPKVLAETSDAAIYTAVKGGEDVMNQLQAYLSGYGSTYTADDIIAYCRAEIDTIEEYRNSVSEVPEQEKSEEYRAAADDFLINIEAALICMRDFLEDADTEKGEQAIGCFEIHNNYVILYTAARYDYLMDTGFTSDEIAAITGNEDDPEIDSAESEQSAEQTNVESPVSSTPAPETETEPAPEVTPAPDPIPEPEPNPAPAPATPVTPAAPVETPQEEVPVVEPQVAGVIGNRNSKKYHVPSCSSVDDMKESNKVAIESAEAAIAAGYEPCKRCH